MKSLNKALQIEKEEADKRISLLVEVLNKWPDVPVLKELATILELAKRSEELKLQLRARRQRVLLSDLLKPEFLLTEPELNSVLRRLNHLLEKYRYSLRLEADAGGLGRLLIPQTRPARRWVAEAVAWITDLARNRALSRLRRCRHCSKWIYAERSHQFYCNESCRKKFSSTADDFKRKRREYMATYRATLKRREVMRIAAIRGKKR